MTACIVEIQVLPEEARDQKKLKKIVAEQIKLDQDKFEFRLKKRSIDARKTIVKYNCKIEVIIGAFTKEEPIFFEARDVSKQKEVVIIGAGPAGLFAALKAIQSGIKPIIYERGKNVQERRRDIAALNKKSLVNPESNYCFGEGGAGTYSDGKLYTR